MLRLSVHFLLEFIISSILNFISSIFDGFGRKSLISPISVYPPLIRSTGKFGFDDFILILSSIPFMFGMSMSDRTKSVSLISSMASTPSPASFTRQPQERMALLMARL